MDGDMSRQNRLFLIDHMCVLPYGHNLNALILFDDALRRHFASSICFAGTELPDYVEQVSLVRRELSYPYGGFIGITPSNFRHRRIFFPPQLGVFARRVLYQGIHEITGLDLVRIRTRQDWKLIWKNHNIGTDDAIFFPSADFYGCITLLDFVASLRDSLRPKIHFRFIGVMENARYSNAVARPLLFEAVRKAIASGVRLTLSAETIDYASYIERLVGVPVSYLPYPLKKPLRPISWGETKVIASPGQGRTDKGFFRLFSIVSRLEQMTTKAFFNYDIQNMSESDRSYRPRYVSQLRFSPKIFLRPARLTQEEIDAVYDNADILLLPYDPRVYALRGSAVYQEGLDTGRPVICSEGLGLSNLVRRYGNGLLAGSDLDFAEKIMQLASLSKDEIERMTASARIAYERDFNEGLRTVVGALTL